MIRAWLFKEVRVRPSASASACRTVMFSLLLKTKPPGFLTSDDVYDPSASNFHNVTGVNGNIEGWIIGFQQAFEIDLHDFTCAFLFGGGRGSTGERGVVCRRENCSAFLRFWFCVV